MKNKQSLKRQYKYTKIYIFWLFLLISNGNISCLFSIRFLFLWIFFLDKHVISPIKYYYKQYWFDSSIRSYLVFWRGEYFCQCHVTWLSAIWLVRIIDKWNVHLERTKHEATVMYMLYIWVKTINGIRTNQG